MRSRKAGRLTTSTNSSIAAGELIRTKRSFSTAFAYSRHQPLISELIRIEVSRIALIAASPCERLALHEVYQQLPVRYQTLGSRGVHRSSYFGKRGRSSSRMVSGSPRKPRQSNECLALLTASISATAPNGSIQTSFRTRHTIIIVDIRLLSS
jgi:hypothetical protein